jgi:hypothetical protein
VTNARASLSTYRTLVVAGAGQKFDTSARQVGRLFDSGASVMTCERSVGLHGRDGVKSGNRTDPDTPPLLIVLKGHDH